MKNKIHTKLWLAAVMLLVISTTQLMGEGLASSTTVTRKNATSLKHHRLDIVRSSQSGKSYIAIEVRDVADNLKVDCFVTIYERESNKILVQFDSKAGIAPARDGLGQGSRAYFYVSDELLGDVKVTYHLPANKTQSHYFIVPRGSLGKLSNLR